MNASDPRGSKRFRASETEQASIRALKNWLLAAPPENPWTIRSCVSGFRRQLPSLSEAQDHSRGKPSKKSD